MTTGTLSFKTVSMAMSVGCKKSNLIVRSRSKTYLATQKGLMDRGDELEGDIFLFFLAWRIESLWW